MLCFVFFGGVGIGIVLTCFGGVRRVGLVVGFRLGGLLNLEGIDWGKVQEGKGQIFVNGLSLGGGDSMYGFFV